MHSGYPCISTDIIIISMKVFMIVTGIQTLDGVWSGAASVCNTVSTLFCIYCADLDYLQTQFGSRCIEFTLRALRYEDD